LDAGIPQAEARDAHEQASGANTISFDRGCTRSVAANHSKTGSAN
jgi:hypothetical protein